MSCSRDVATETAIIKIFYCVDTYIAKDILHNINRINFKIENKILSFLNVTILKKNKKTYLLNRNISGKPSKKKEYVRTSDLKEVIWKPYSLIVKNKGILVRREGVRAKMSKFFVLILSGILKFFKVNLPLKILIIFTIVTAEHFNSLGHRLPDFSFTVLEKCFKNCPEYLRKRRVLDPNISYKI